MNARRLVRFGAFYGAALAIGYFGPLVADRVHPGAPPPVAVGPGDLPAFVDRTNLAQPGAIRHGAVVVKVPSDACRVPAGSRSCYAILILSAGTAAPGDALARYVVP